jgi:cytoskeletal protein CcmA (bactofilin family)
MLWTRRKAGERLAGERFMTLIDASATVDGRLEFRESVRIDGQVVGSVRLAAGSAATVAVAEGAVVRGDIDGHRVLVAGQVHGNIRASERVELFGTAQVCGDITYGSIGIAHGARVAGMLVELDRSDDASSRTDALIRSARATGDEARSA